MTMSCPDSRRHGGAAHSRDSSAVLRRLLRPARARDAVKAHPYMSADGEASRPAVSGWTYLRAQTTVRAGGHIGAKESQ